MSGGHFDYKQYWLNDIASSIDELIASAGYSPETIERFLEAAYSLRMAAEMAQRVDWLVSAMTEKRVSTGDG